MPTRELERLVGSSPAMELVRAKAARILARRGARQPPVLLQGATGSGKGLLARCLHAGSARRGRAFVEVNCSAIPESLVEAELFGFERGAFTDAQKSKPGLLELAHGGTLFLDEVSLLPSHLQPKLLKALEDRAVRRLGGTRVEPADVWLVAATNDDLPRAVAEQRFRGDLYHRLAVMTIELPSLTERGDDVLELAGAFLPRICAEYGLSPKTFGPSALAALRAHAWPGNVRELANAVERGVLIASGDQIDAAALELSARPTAAPARDVDERTRGAVTSGVQGGAAGAMDDVLRRHLQEVLQATGWNVSQTAARLGLTRNTVRARMRKYGFRRDGVAPLPKPTRAEAPRSVPPAFGAPSRSVDVPTPVSTRRSDLGWQARLLSFVKVEASNGLAPAVAARALEAAEEKLHGFGARTVEVGVSGLVAAFGIEPIEDAVRRATLAALAVTRPSMVSNGAVLLEVAVHAGQALVRSGAQVPVDQEALRSAVAALARLESTRVAGERGVLMGAAATAFIARDFELAAVGPDCWVASAPRAGAAVRQCGGPPLVGRDAELALLVARVEHAALGRGHAVAITGEAGIGKSRLLVELRARAAGGTEWMDVRCWSHLASVPYAVVVDLLRKLADLDERDGAERVEAKLAEAARPLTLAPAQTTALLELFGFFDEARAGLLTPEGRKQSVVSAVRVLACAAGRRRPLVLALEDTHWMDATSEGCLAALVDAIASEPVLVVGTARPSVELRLRGSVSFTQLALLPLTDPESVALLSGLEGAEALGRERARDIARRAEGNPFFLEELAQSVLQHGTAGLALPETISAVLLHRLRLLPPDLRHVLEVGAVLGREFRPSLLERLLPSGDRTGAQLGELAKLGLLLLRPRPGEPVVSFKHALIQEVAYADLPDDQRRELHGAAAHALEEAHARRRDEVIELLAHHYDRSGDAVRAVEALSASARRAARGYALEEAMALLRRAVAHVGELPPERRDPERLRLVNELAHVLCVSGRYQDCLELLDQHAALVNALDRPDLGGPYHFWLGYINSLLSRHADAEAHSHAAIELARAARLLQVEGRAHFVLAREAFFRCRFSEGIECGQRAVALLEHAGEPWWLGQAHWVVGINQLFKGELVASLDSEARAASLGEALGDARLKAYAGWTASFAHARAGDGAAALGCARAAFNQSPDPVNTALARGFLGFAHAAAGEPVAAVAHLERTVDEMAAFGLHKQGGTFRAFLADAALSAGDRARAREEATAALAACSEADFPFGAAWAERVLARLAALEGVSAAAAALFDGAAATFAQIGAALEHERTRRERERTLSLG